MRTVFYCHRATEPEAETTRACGNLESLLFARSTGLLGNFRIIPGRQDHATNFHGNWDAWAQGVPHRINSMTRRPLYNLFVVPQTTIGKATAQILQAALELRRPVYYWDGAGWFVRVREIRCFDPMYFKGGWGVVIPSTSLLSPTTP